jgi:hypothetical protein
MKKKEILFYPANDFAAEHIDPPSTASSSNIPRWYKDMKKYINNDKKFDFNQSSNLTVKSCLPVVDAFTVGYTINLHCDIQITRNNDEIKIVWPFRTDKISPPITQRGFDDQKIGWKNIYGYDNPQFNWMSQWSIKTPKGYSCLFTHPLNRPDLPFYTIDGIIDTDGWGNAGNHPFLLKKDWEGTIPQGTPIVQVIPFKRDPWYSKVNKEMVNESIKQFFLRDRFLKGYYKNFIWNSKTYK